MSSISFEKSERSIADNYDEVIKYLEENEVGELIELYKKIIEEGSLLLLTVEDCELAPKEVTQILRVINKL